MKTWFYFFIVLMLQSCTDDNDSTSTTEIKIDKYTFDFPSSYKKFKQKTFNSYMGEISNDTVTLKFHFSNHVQPPIKTPAEFIEDEDWKSNVILEIMRAKQVSKISSIQFSKPRPATRNDSTVGRGCDFVVKCNAGKIEFEAPIYLPQKMKGITILIDTTLGQHREIFSSDDPEKGLTGIFLKHIPINRKDSLDRNALSITTTSLTKNKQKDILKILSSFRINGHD